MPSYKLIYFNSKARAEPARILFALAGVDYEDKRIDYFKEWKDLKPNTPFGALPILEVDGKQLTESKAIFRYLAREFGYHGKNNWESSHIDCIMDMFEDLHTGVGKILAAQGEQKEKALGEYKAHARKVLSNIEKKLQENDGGNGYFVGDKISIADVCLFCDVQFVAAVFGDKDATKEFTKLEALASRVGGIERIAAWVAKRPVTRI